MLSTSPEKRGRAVRQRSLSPRPNPKQLASELRAKCFDDARRLETQWYNVRTSWFFGRYLANKGPAGVAGAVLQSLTKV